MEEPKSSGSFVEKIIKEIKMEVQDVFKCEVLEDNELVTSESGSRSRIPILQDIGQERVPSSVVTVKEEDVPMPIVSAWVSEDSVFSTKEKKSNRRRKDVHILRTYGDLDNDHVTLRERAKRKGCAPKERLILKQFIPHVPECRWAGIPPSRPSGKQGCGQIFENNLELRNHAQTLAGKACNVNKDPFENLSASEEEVDVVGDWSSIVPGTTVRKGARQNQILRLNLRLPATTNSEELQRHITSTIRTAQMDSARLASRKCHDPDASGRPPKKANIDDSADDALPSKMSKRRKAIQERYIRLKLRNGFNNLGAKLPGLLESERVTNAAILKEAILNCQELRAADKELRREKAALVQQGYALSSQLLKASDINCKLGDKPPTHGDSETSVDPLGNTASDGRHGMPKVCDIKPPTHGNSRVETRVDPLSATEDDGGQVPRFSRFKLAPTHRLIASSRHRRKKLFSL